jgi:hypothetical protein
MMKSFLLTTLFILIILSVSTFGQNTITTTTPIQTSFCAGGSIIVEYTSTGSFPAGCTFSIELSNSSGNFTNPTIIGSLPLNVGAIPGTIPTSTPFGFNYRVRVVADNPSTIGSASTTPLVITSTAASATIFSNPSGGVCHGDTVSLWATYNATYQWSTGETTQTIKVTESGSYVVTVTNFLTGCQVSSNPVNVVVHPTPIVNLGPDRESCNGHNILLNAGAGFSNYHWSDSSSLQYINISHSGIYSVSVTDTFGCIGKDTLKVLFHPNPIVSLGHDTSLCGNSKLLSVAAGYSSYNWNNGLSFNPNLLVQTSGNYFITVVDSNGCVGRDTILINIHPLPVIDLGNDLSACGNSIELNAGAGYSLYNWNNGLCTNKLLTVNTSGTYFVKVTDNFGCIGRDTIKVKVFSLPEIKLVSDIQLSTIDSITLDAGPGHESYHWSTGANSQTIQIFGKDYPLGPINITVTVIDSNGCYNSGHVKLSFIPNLGINEFAIFPVPFHDVVSIISSQNLSGSRPVFCDILGRYHYPEFTITNSKMQVNRGNIANGSYLLFLESNKKLNYIGKLVIN